MQYNAVDGGWAKHGARCGIGRRVARATPRHSRSRSSARRLFSFLSGGYIFTRSAPLAIVYLLLAAVWVWFLRRRSRPSLLYLAALAVVRAVRRVDGPLGVLVVRPRPELDRLRPRRPLSGGGGGARPHAGPWPPAAHRGLRIPGGRRCRRCIRFSRQGRPRRRDARAHLRAPRQPRGLLERPRPDDGDGAGGRAGACRRPPRSPRLEGAGRRRRGAAVLRLLLHSCLAAASSCSPSSLVLYFAFTTTRLASFASLVAIAAPVAAVLWRLRDLGTLYTRDHGRRLAHASGPHAAALVSGGAAGRRGGAGRDRARAPRRAVAALACASPPEPRSAGAGGRHRRWLVALPESRGGSAWVKDRVQTFIAGTDETDAAEGTGRLISLNTGRPPLWREALEQSRSHRLLRHRRRHVRLHPRPFPRRRGRRQARPQPVVQRAQRAGHGRAWPVRGGHGPVRRRRGAQPLRRPARPRCARSSWRFRRAWWPSSCTSPGTGTGTWRRSAWCSSCSPPPAPRTWRPGRRPAARRGAAAARDAWRRRRMGRETAEAGGDAAGAGPGGGARPRGRLRTVATVALVLLAASWLVPYLSAREESAALAASGDGRHRRRPGPRAPRRAPRPARRGPADHRVAGAAAAGAQRRGVGGTSARRRGCSPTTTRCSTTRACCCCRRSAARRPPSPRCGALWR